MSTPSPPEFPMELQAAATHYVSTYCIDGALEPDPEKAAALHGSCRLTCKHCGKPCQCSHHAT
jgi:hypothetical protein